MVAYCSVTPTLESLPSTIDTSTVTFAPVLESSESKEFFKDETSNCVSFLSIANLPSI